MHSEDSAFKSAEQANGGQVSPNLTAWRRLPSPFREHLSSSLSSQGLTDGNVVPQGTFSQVYSHMWLSPWEGVPLASGGCEKPEKLLNFLPCTGQPPQYTVSYPAQV